MAGRLAARITRIAGSATMAVAATVDRLRSAGVEVIDFGAGEPDFTTPDAAKLAARQALDENFTKYTPVPGIASLRRAICDRYRADYGVEFSEAEVMVSAGGKQALYNTAFALFGPRDEVITHSPHWLTITEQITMAEAKPVIVRTHAEDGFTLHADPMLEAMTPRTRGIIINSPSNPTGAVMAEAQFERLAEAAAQRGIWLIVDMCYEKLIYDSRPHNLPAVLSRCCRECGVICGSTSKTYAMTGWRCGWTLGPRDLIAAESAIQSHSTSSVTSISQKAALAALTGSQDRVGRMLDEYRERRDNLYEWLTVEPALGCQKPDGGFYMFVDVGAVLSIDGLRTSIDFARALLDEQRVAVTPGEAFDAPGFIRISFATSMEHLREGSRRLVEFARTHTEKSRPAAAGH